MNTAQDVYSKVGVTRIVLVVSILAAALVFPRNIWAAAGNNQVCNPGSSCTVGEFLYDDSYAPLTTASCQITSRYPDGTLFLNNQAATVSSQGDAWYSYTFTTPATIGLYRTYISCLVGSDTMKLDKSFEVKADSSSLSANDIASATWNYSDRTLSSFGSLVSDIWNSATRTLTGVGLTSGQLAAQSDVNNVSSQVSNLSTQVNNISAQVNTINNNNSAVTNSALSALEKVANPPIIQTSIVSSDDATTPTDLNFNTKINNTRAVVNQLSVNTQYIESKAYLIDAKWSSLSKDQISSMLKSLVSVIGQEKDGKDKNSIFGNGNFLVSQWDWKEASGIVSQAKSINSAILSLNNKVEQNGKSTSSHQDLKNIASSVGKLKLLVGQAISASKDKTLYSDLNQIVTLSSVFDSKRADVSHVLLSWGMDDKKSIDSKLDKLSVEVQKMSMLPKVDYASLTNNTETNPDKVIKNKALALLGLIDANKQLLMNKSTNGFSSTWLELGSIVFKTIITNPSNSISQTVPLKYYLPPEVKKENITQIDDGLTVNYDEDKNQYYVSGTFVLAPGESKTLTCSTDESVFTIPVAEVATLKKEAEDLSAPLKNTSYYAQGVTLKSDIDVSLDNVLSLNKDAITPDEKISAFRQATIELNSAKSEIEKLKDLVTTAGSVGTMFGFVGGTQTLAVWGLIIVMVAGFVFLTLYMKTIAAHTFANQNGQPDTMNMGTSGQEISSKGKKKLHVEESLSAPVQEPRKQNRFGSSMKVGVMIIGAFGLSAVGLATFVAYSKPAKQAEKVVKVAVAKQASKSKQVLGATDEAKPPVATTSSVTIFVPDGSSVDIHKDAGVSSDVLFTLNKSVDAIKIGTNDSWVKVNIDNSKEKMTGWVDADFVETGTAKLNKDSEVSRGSVEEGGGTAVVNSDITGSVKVRQSPIDGDVITKVFADDKFKVVSEKDNWVEVKLEDGTSGWISEDFVTVNP